MNRSMSSFRFSQDVKLLNRSTVVPSILKSGSISIGSIGASDVLERKVGFPAEGTGRMTCEADVCVLDWFVFQNKGRPPADYRFSFDWPELPFDTSCPHSNEVCSFQFS